MAMALSTLVLASAGGGSSGFGRGGGGGGLGGGGFGGSGYGGGAVGGAGLVLFMVIWGLVLVAIFYALLSSTRTRRRKRKRLERVHLTAVLDDYVETSSGGIVMRSGEHSPRTRLAEYWTLSKRDGRWALLSVEQDREGAHNLQDEIVASPWADSRLRDESLVEQAV